jgi:ADP-ribose pyrophosphatase
MSRKFEIHGREKKYESNWLKVYEYKISRDGKPGLFSVVERADGVTIIAEGPDGSVLMEKNYRFPTQEYSWEVPGGGVDEGESAAEAARRELREETGVEADLEQIGVFRPIAGLTPQRSTAFHARLTPDQVKQAMAYDNVMDEIVDRRMVTRDELREMVQSGQVTDSFTLSALALMNF